jgi:hypothetical protein
MNTQLKILLIKALKFVLILIMLDFGLGMVVRAVFFTQKSGKFYRMYRSFSNANADIFIFGSSRSNHHYHPEILKKEMGLTSYNVGAQGQQILFQTTVQKIVLNRVKPRLIILDVSPDWMYESSEAYDNLNELRPFYFRFSDIIGPVLTLRSRFQKLWLNSVVYQYNSTIVHIIYYRVKPQLDLDGYVPLLHEMTTKDYVTQIAADSVKFSSRKPKIFDPVYVNALKSFLKNAKSKNVKVVMVYSPDFGLIKTGGNSSAIRINDIGREMGVPVIDYTLDPYFRNKPEFFNDIRHLNDEGAKEFSRQISQKLKAYL